MHLAFFVVCGVLDDFVIGLIDFLFFMLNSLIFLLDVFDIVVLMNRIAYVRLRGIALVDIFDIVFNSISGLLARGCGLV